MMNTTRFLTKFFMLTLLLSGLAIVEANAQADPDGGPVPSDIPIDGGASLLVAGGVAFGLKKLRDKRNLK